MKVPLWIFVPLTIATVMFALGWGIFLQSTAAGLLIGGSLLTIVYTVPFWLLYKGVIKFTDHYDRDY